MGKRRKSRVLALQLLYQLDRGSRPLEEVLAQFWESQGVPEAAVREFAEEIVRGTLQRVEEIDGMIKGYAEHWDPDRMAVVDRNILRLALYEILFREDIPPKVTINEYVDIAKKYSTEDSGAFVNGILDRAFRETMPAAEPSSDAVV